MIYLVLGLGALALFIWAGRGKRVLKHREWRVASGALALGAFTAAAYVGVQGKWGAAIVLMVLGLWLAASARKSAAAPRPPATARMSAAEARRILGVEEGATPEEIQAAYARLMRRAHPDAGGTAGLAAQLTAARERLLKG